MILTNDDGHQDTINRSLHYVNVTTLFNTTFNNISYIVAVSIIGGGNQNTLRKALTCCNSQHDTQDGEYRKKLCISRRNLPLKGFLGMGMRIIYYNRFKETFSKMS
jgi:hypothetical protein